MTNVEQHDHATTQSILSERDYVTFVYMSSQIRLPLSICLSVVCNVRLPYSSGWDFPQYFYAILYRSHLLTITQNFTEMVPGEP